MKKSQMLLQIQDDLKYRLWSYFADSSEHAGALEDAGIDINEIAIAVLDRIETAGMLPPVITGIVEVQEDKQTGEMVLPVWSWEPEND